LIILLAGTIYSFTPSPHVRQDEPEIKSSQHWLEIRDLSYQNFDQDQKYLSLKAERFSIQKKKIGFFRIGLVNIGVFDNAQIDFYLDQNAEPGRKMDSDDEFFFRHSLTSIDGIMPPYSSNRISSFTLASVSINLINGNNILSTISSDSAVISPGKSGIEFKGNVKVVSNNNILKTKYLFFHPEKHHLQTKNDFTLESADETILGKDITLDMFLNIINDPSG